MNDKTGAKAMISRNQRPQKGVQGKGSTVVQVPKGKLGALSIPFPANRLATNKQQKKAELKGVQKPVTAKRTYVLDTNVLMHDPLCLFNFKEHDIVIPFMVLEELDNHKKGNDERNRNVREVSRTLDSLFEDEKIVASVGASLEKASSNQATGKLSIHPNDGFDPAMKPDNVILETVKRIKNATIDREVVLVSNDINMRLKARSMGLKVEDYKTDAVEEKDGDYFHSGFSLMQKDFWDNHENDIEIKRTDDITTVTIRGKDTRNLYLNHTILEEQSNTGKPFALRVIHQEGNVATLQSLHNYRNKKVFGITARNNEQSIALNLLMDPDIHIVSLAGKAGSGKTLIALAAGLEQVIEKRAYSEIIFTRATVSIGEEIGFLPGTEEEKMGPWFGALEDNLEVLTWSSPEEKETKHNKKFEKSVTEELIASKLKIKSMNFMRGRSFFKKYLIVDEAQNLTPKQMKALITRAGPGTKLVMMGNIAQIDTPYLTAGSCGLTYGVKKMQGWYRAGHATLPKGERSELATYAEEVL